MPSKKKSEVWKHFELQDNDTKVRCRLRDLKMAYHSSTSSMRYHIVTVSLSHVLALILSPFLII